MSPGSLSLCGIGHWISPTFQPGGNFHLISVGKPASPENFQYVCQPGVILKRSPIVNGFPGMTALASATSVALTICLPSYTCATVRGTPSIDNSTTPQLATK